MKLCTQCEYYQSTSTYNSNVGVRHYDKCKHGTDINPINGESLNPRDCAAYRAEVSSIQNKCGPEGKHYKENNFLRMINCFNQGE